MRTPRLLLSILVLSLALLPAVGLRSVEAAKVRSAEEMEPTCRYWANQYAIFAKHRDAGTPAELILVSLEQHVNNGDIPKEVAESFYAAVTWVYENRLSSDDTRQVIYGSCMKANTEVEA